MFYAYLSKPQDNTHRLGTGVAVGSQHLLHDLVEICNSKGDCGEYGYSRWTTSSKGRDGRTSYLGRTIVPSYGLEYSIESCSAYRVTPLRTPITITCVYRTESVMTSAVMKSDGAASARRGQDGLSHCRDRSNLAHLCQFKTYSSLFKKNECQLQYSASILFLLW